ncbi:MAG: hypothetical protein JO257_03760 [Deltaproteobacteria bacterium]|nr:hypothetical protein [Deltaproteobacteria bacterium]
MNRALLALVLVPSLAGAQPAPAPAPDTSKMDAKQEMQTGVKLLEAKDYLGALAIFKDAYARFPSAKILLNIGTTLRLLDRNADAANAYQHYLDSKDTDPARRAEVESAIADLDKTVATLSMTVTPPDAELEFTDDWVPAAQARVWRVPAGPITVHARAKGYLPSAESVNVAAGERKSVLIALVAEPKQTTTVITNNELPVAPALVEGPRARFGGLATMHVSVLPKIGSALLVGGTFDVTEQLAVEGALILGPGLVSSGMATLPPPKIGGYVGAAFSFSGGAVRPKLAAGMPIFADDGARFFVRGAGGLEYLVNHHWSVTAELGLEVSLNARSDIRETAFVPSLGIVGRP